ncbi:GDCCVxC domain-containing (seleno)protein [Cognatishimia sp.]|uniref:GDCCVxC domain-containing (seleno)protein n=1 Tax=Cognatishimia sp. TaxID=2211648 RepID=UPI003BA92699
MSQVVLISRLTCPACAHEENLTMPTDMCQFFHECSACKQVIRPKAGDCCVYCSYGSIPCPPIQQGDDCCGVTS